MNKYTALSILHELELGPRAWLRLILAISLLVTLSTADQSSEWLAPNEAGRAWPRWGVSRVGRWVGRAGRIVWASRWSVMLRTGLLAGLLMGSGLLARWPSARHWVWLPVVDWALSVAGWIEPKLALQPIYRGGHVILHRAYQLSVWGLTVLTLHPHLSSTWSGLVLGSLVVCERDGSRVELERQPGPQGQTTYRARLSGEFVIDLTPRDEFEKRLMILDLRRLRTPGREASPWGIVRQEALADLFGVPQERISQWQGYVQDGRWAQLLSVADKSLLTDELRQQIVDVWATNLWQTAAQVRERLAHTGVAVAERLVEEASRQSGLRTLRATLKEQCIHGPQGLRPDSDYLVRHLFQVIDQLQARVDGTAPLPTEQLVDVMALRQIAEVPLPDQGLDKPWPWLFQVDHWLFGAWTAVEEAGVHCIYCGSDHVAVKSKRPRLKAYRDEQGQRQTVEVYRYYCQNPDCPYQTFTHLPPGLIAHSVWSLDTRLKALEVYAGLRTTYRAVSAALGVAPSTLYHWLDQFGAEPLQVAALFGLVRSSGVVGIDEKYVLVPKNDKPAGQRRKWMYVYVAVDVHTLDLLHIQIFPHLGKDSAHTFLLQLRAKGYHPRVFVTDLCQDYAEPLAHVFPQAVHHECVFHALQTWHRDFKKAFGPDYAQTHPELLALRHQIDRIFQAKTRRTVDKRYTELMAQREKWIQAEPRLQPFFDSVARHYPFLVNAYDHPLIPLTNNATERLIRRFDQHYQNFAGFDSLETAQAYLHLFELTYRFTPFGPEVQPHLRGKCPLELAGYDLTQVPLARYLREHATVPLIPTRVEVVPK